MSGQPWALTTGEPYRLAPHEWDRLGKPPPVGPDYETGFLREAVAYAAALVRSDELREEADRLREDADEAEDDADRAVTESDGAQKALAEVHPKLAAAIKDEPDLFQTETAVRAYLAGVGA